MQTQHRSNMNSPESDGSDGHSYPPRRNTHSPSHKLKLRSKKSFKRLFIVHRRKREPVPSAPDSQSSDICEFSSTPPSMTTSRSSFTSSTRSSKFSRPRFRKPAPPVIVPCWRYKAEPQAFTVRVETEFTVTCTVIQPKSRFRFGWSSFSRSRICFLKRRSRTGDGDGKPQKQKQKKRRRSFWGVTIQRDVCDDAASDIEPQEEMQTRTRLRARANARMLQGKRAKAIRRNSGWAGVFSASESDRGTSTIGSTRSSHDDQEQPSFTIDRASKMLLVPGMDIGIARVVKQEVEDIPPTIRLVQPAPGSQQREGYNDGRAEVREYHVFTSDSDESWLEL